MGATRRRTASVPRSIRSRIGLLVIQFETAQEMPAKKRSFTTAAKGKAKRKAKRKPVEEEHAVEEEQVPDEDCELGKEREEECEAEVESVANTASGNKSSSPGISTQEELTEQQEEILAAFTQDHEELYDQTSRKNTSRKDRLWEECGALVGVNGELILYEINLICSYL